MTDHYGHEGGASPDEEIVEALPQHAGEVLVVDGVEDLRLVQVAAEGVRHTGVPQGAQRTVQLQRVVVELPQLLVLRQLQDVHAPGHQRRTVENGGERRSVRPWK